MGEREFLSCLIYCLANKPPTRILNLIYSQFFLVFHLCLLFYLRFPNFSFHSFYLKFFLPCLRNSSAFKISWIFLYMACVWLYLFVFHLEYSFFLSYTFVWFSQRCFPRLFYSVFPIGLVILYSLLMFKNGAHKRLSELPSSPRWLAGWREDKRGGI